MPDKYGNFTINDGLQMVQGLQGIAQENRKQQAVRDNAEIDDIVKVIDTAKNSKDQVAREEAEKDITGRRTSLVLAATQQQNLQTKSTMENHKMKVEQDRRGTMTGVREAENFMINKEEAKAVDRYIEVMNKHNPDGYTYERKTDGPGEDGRNADGSWTWKRFDHTGKLLDETPHTMDQMRQVGARMTEDVEEWTKNHNKALYNSRRINMEAARPENQTEYTNPKTGDVAIGMLQIDRWDSQLTHKKIFNKNTKKEMTQEEIMGWDVTKKSVSELDKAKVSTEKGKQALSAAKVAALKQGTGDVQEKKKKAELEKEWPDLPAGFKIEDGKVVEKVLDEDLQPIWSDTRKAVELTKKKDKWVKEQFDHPDPKAQSNEGVEGKKPGGKPKNASEAKQQVLSPEASMKIVKEKHPNAKGMMPSVQIWVEQMPEGKDKNLFLAAIDSNDPEGIIAMLDEFLNKHPAVNKKSGSMGIAEKDKKEVQGTDYSGGISYTP